MYLNWMSNVLVSFSQFRLLSATPDACGADLLVSEVKLDTFWISQV